MLKRALPVAMPLCALFTAACGGGGVNSTPAPPPNPTPTPTNASLLDLRHSESFTNNAASATGKFHSDGRVATDATAKGAQLTISYDAVTRSYAVSTQGRSQTFRQPDIDASQSSNGITVFSRTSGSLIESLSLTNPGTAGALTYQYVGAGFWQRARTNISTVDFSFDAFTYGVETPDANLPRTGTAAYAVDLIGASTSGIPLALAGDGTLQVDFADGSILSKGTMRSFSDTGVVIATGAYIADGKLSANSNAFSGTFGFGGLGAFSGNWQGRFYGDGAQEIGSVWYATAPTGEIATGVLVGRDDSSIALYNSKLTPLRFDEKFGGAHTDFSYGVDGFGKSIYVSSPFKGVSHLSYSAIDQSFTYGTSTDPDYKFLPSAKILAESNANIAVYSIVGSDGLRYKLTLSNPGSGNNDIAMTYTSFAIWERPQSDGVFTWERTFAWGVGTDPLLVPRTGSAHYEGILRGTAVAMEDGGPVYTLAGSSTFDVNFAGGNVTGSLHPIGTDRSTGGVRDFGAFALGRPVASLPSVSADIVDAQGRYLGNFAGSLFGPRATEIGGSFGFKSEFFTPDSPPSANAVFMSGAVLAKTNGN